MDSLIMFFMRYILLLIVICIYSDSFSQIRIRNTSLLIPDTNILYRNENNYLKISGKRANIRLISKTGSTIHSSNKNEFVVVPHSLRNDTLLVVMGKRVLSKHIFTIDTLSPLRFQLGNITKDTASIAEIIANRQVIAKIKNSLFYYPTLITSFNLTFIAPNWDTVAKEIESNRNLISKYQELIIRKLAPHSKLIFNDIVVLTADSRVRAFPGFTLITK